MLTAPGGNVRLMTQRVLSIANLLVGDTAGNPGSGRSCQSPAARTDGCNHDRTFVSCKVWTISIGTDSRDLRESSGDPWSEVGSPQPPHKGPKPDGGGQPALVLISAR